MKFLDLFAGIGGFRLGMEQAGHECVGYVEIDKYARKSYQAIHNTEGEWTASDITTVTDEHIRQLRRERGEIQAICGGFPCQAFSVAGKRGGFNDTRGTLFFEIMRFASILRPRYLFLENVKGLLSHDNGNTFETILRTLDELGYWYEWQVLNSKDFGVPQNRERVFIIGHLRGTGTRKVFPVRRSNGKTINEIIPGKQATRVVSPDGLSYCLSSEGGGWGAKTGLYMIGTLDRPGTHEFSNRVYPSKGLARTLMGSGGNNEDKTGLYLVNKNGDEIKLRGETVNCIDANYFKGLGVNQARTGVLEVRPCLTPDRAEKRQNGRRLKNNGEPMLTITSQDVHGVVVKIKDGTKKGYTEFTPTEETTIDLSVPTSETRRGRVKEGVTPTLDTGCQVGVFNNYRIRKLTPRECFRLQGFPDWAFEKAKEVNSDTQLYKQAGNTVTVNVVYELARRLNSEKG